MAEFDPTRPFTSQQASRAGMSRRRLQGREFRQVVRGVYAKRTAPELETRVRTGLLVAKEPTAFVSHHDAARLWGGVVPHSSEIHVSVPAGSSRRRRDGVKVHASRRNPVRFRGLPVTSPVDTFLDMASVIGLVDLVVLGDSLVRRGRVTPEHLVQGAEAATGKHVRAARRAARMVRKEVDSPMETRTRLLIVLAGLPEPEVNILFPGEDGEILRRLDLGYRGLRLAIEYDGEQHLKQREVYEGDVLRHEEFDDLGWRIIVVLSKDIYVHPSRTLQRVVSALRRCGVVVPPLRDDWRRYFPERKAAA